MSSCALCKANQASRGLLCGDCVAPIDVKDLLCPEQIVSTFSQEKGAWLIDRWGRPHSLGEHTIVGRSAGLAIYSSSISRKHAIIEGVGDRWTISDLSSRNGTYVNEKLVSGAVQLVRRDQVCFGTVRFLFVTGSFGSRRARAAQFGTRSPLRGLNDATAGEHWQRDLGLQLLEPRRGGGGLLLISGKQLRLTLIQLSFLRTLVERLHEDAALPEAVRGFVPSIELLAMLPWSTSTPDDGNLKQLVRRLRRRLSDVGLDIEGSHGLGYRLSETENRLGPVTE